MQRAIRRPSYSSLEFQTANRRYGLRKVVQFPYTGLLLIVGRTPGPRESPWTRSSHHRADVGVGRGGSAPLHHRGGRRGFVGMACIRQR
jgi:hypothetical protein